MSSITLTETSGTKATWTIQDSPWSKSVTGSSVALSVPSLKAKYVYSGKNKGGIGVLGTLRAGSNVSGTIEYYYGTWKTSGSDQGFYAKAMTSGTFYNLTLRSGSAPTIQTSSVFNSNNKTARTVGVNFVTHQLFYISSKNDTSLEGHGDTTAAKTFSSTGTLTLNVPPTASVGELSASMRYDPSEIVDDYYTKITRVSVQVENAQAYYGGDFSDDSVYQAGIKFEIGDQSHTIHESGLLYIDLDTAGTFTPKVTVTDSRGQTYVKTFSPITVKECSMPTAVVSDLSIDTTTCYSNITNARVTISNSTAYHEGTITQTRLSVGDDVASGDGDGVLTVRLTKNGTFTPKVFITDSNDLTTEYTLETITVNQYTANISNIVAERISNDDEDHPGTQSDIGINAMVAATIDYPNPPPLNFIKEPLVTIDGNEYNAYIPSEDTEPSSGKLYYEKVYTRSYELKSVTPDDTEFDIDWDVLLNAFANGHTIPDYRILLRVAAIVDGDQRGPITIYGDNASTGDAWRTTIILPNQWENYGINSITIQSLKLCTIKTICTSSYEYVLVENTTGKNPYLEGWYEKSIVDWYLDWTPLDGFIGEKIDFNKYDLSNYHDIVTNGTTMYSLTDDTEPVTEKTYYEVTLGRDAYFRLYITWGGGYTVHIEPFPKVRAWKPEYMKFELDEEIQTIPFSSFVGTESGDNQYEYYLDGHYGSLFEDNSDIEIGYSVGSGLSFDDIDMDTITINSDDILDPNELEIPVYDLNAPTIAASVTVVSGDISEKNPSEEGWYTHVPYITTPVTLYGNVKYMFDSGTTYNIGVQATTGLAKTTTEYTNIPQSFFLLSAKAGGKSLGIGMKPPEGDEIDGLHVSMNTVFYENVIFQKMAGVIQMFAGSTEPTGWLFCDGSEYLKTDYPILYAAIGDTYGDTTKGAIAPSDSDHFRVPDFQGRVGVGVGESTATGHTAHTLGQEDGQETVTLTYAQSGLPAHTHSFTQPKIPNHYHNMGTRFSDGSGSNNAYQYSANRKASSRNTNTDGGGGRCTEGAVGAVSGGAQDASSAHTNMPPFIAINYIIATGEMYGDDVES